MAGKGVAMVVLDKQDHLNKDQDLIADKDSYKLITGDPTSRQKKITHPNS